MVDLRAVLANSSEFSEIESNILAAAKNGKCKSLFITSCHPYEGKTTASIILATALATQRQSRVLLIEGNLLSPKLYQYFNLKSSPGLQEFLTGTANADELFRKTEYANLFVMTQGADIRKSVESLKSPEFLKKIESLKEKFDFIIFDGPSVLGNSDSSVTAKSFDGIIVVIECEKTRWEVLRLVKEKVSQVGGNLLGVVLNKRKFYIPKGIYEKF